MTSRLHFDFRPADVDGKPFSEDFKISFVLVVLPCFHRKMMSSSPVTSSGMEKLYFRNINSTGHYVWDNFLVLNYFYHSYTQA